MYQAQQQPFAMVSAAASPSARRPQAIEAALLQKLLEAQPSGFTRDSAEGGIAFTYGELTFDGVEALVRDAIRRRQKAAAAPPRCFLDLGSGTGRVALCAAACFPELDCCVGVELSEERHAIALQGRDAASDGAPEALLRERVLFVQGDARASVAPIAAADIIWVSNTCFPEDLNTEVSSAIAQSASEGAVVYSTHALHLGDRMAGDGPLDEVPISCSWTLAHRALVAVLADLPQLIVGDVAGSETEEAAAQRAFNHWATGYSAMREAGPGPPEEEEYFVLEGEHVAAAIATALLLGGVQPWRVLDLLHAERGALRDLWSAAAAQPDGGLDVGAFEELCGDCWELALPEAPNRCSAAGCGGFFSLCGAL